MADKHEMLTGEHAKNEMNDMEAAEANLRMDDDFYGEYDKESPAEAVDFPEIFRNQS